MTESVPEPQWVCACLKESLPQSQTEGRFSTIPELGLFPSCQHFVISTRGNLQYGGTRLTSQPWLHTKPRHNTELETVMSKQAIVFYRSHSCSVSRGFSCLCPVVVWNSGSNLPGYIFFPALKLAKLPVSPQKGVLAQAPPRKGKGKLLPAQQSCFAGRQHRRAMSLQKCSWNSLTAQPHSQHDFQLLRRS